MAVELQSKVAGRLIQNGNFADLWVAAVPLAIPYFDGVRLEITFEEIDPSDPISLERADEVLTNLLQLTSFDRQLDTAVALENYESVLEYLQEPLKLMAPDDIWQHIHPTSLLVTSESDGDNKDDYVVVEGSCDWEEEHGISLVFRRGLMLTRLSQYDGHLTEAHAWGKPMPDPLMDRYHATFGR
jgi:hypothetical protein